MEDQDQIFSSKHELELFKRSPVWEDFKLFLNNRIEDLSNKIDEANDIIFIKELVGAKKNCKDILALPDQLLEELENQKQNKQTA